MCLRGSLRRAVVSIWVIDESCLLWCAYLSVGRSLAKDLSLLSFLDELLAQLLLVHRLLRTALARAVSEGKLVWDSWLDEDMRNRPPPTCPGVFLTCAGISLLCTGICFVCSNIFPTRLGVFGRRYSYESGHG